MEILQATPLIAKAFWSAAIVLGLSALAERVSTRIAGILAGAPQNVVLVYFFVGRDMGIDHVTQSTPHAIASFSATIAFALAYYLGSSGCARYSAIAGSLSGIAAFSVVAIVLSMNSFTLSSATILTICSTAIAIWFGRRIELRPVEKPIQYTPGLLILRASLAAILIVSVIALAEVVGPRWTGLLAGFPTIVLPTLLIIHTTYGAAQTHAIIRNFPVGLFSIILYILSVPVTFPLWGVYGGTAASLSISIVYLALAALVGSHRSANRAERERSREKPLASNVRCRSGGLAPTSRADPNDCDHRLLTVQKLGLMHNELTECSSGKPRLKGSEQMSNLHHSIRLARVEDAPAISALVERAYAPWLPIVERRPRPMDDDFVGRCASGHAYVLENGGDLLGAAIIENMPGHLFLHNVVVEPERHSEGIGREIMLFVEDEARKRGFPEVQLTTLEGMVRNVAIYKRLGYVITGRLNVGKFDRLTMTKRFE